VATETGDESGFGLAPIIFILGLVLATGVILLVGRGRRDEPDEQPPLPRVIGPGPSLAPTDESAAAQTAVTEAATASGNTILCENCGRSSPAEFHFCDGCGQPLKRPEQPSPEE
jgi:hypothetical protein